MFLRKTEGFKMSYVKLTNYAIKDALLTGDPNKIVKGADIDAEFNAIATASAVTDAAYVAADAVVTASYVAADAVVAATVASKLDTATAAITYAPLSSPALVGVPTAPTAPVGTNTTQIATMAALLNQAFTTGFPSQIDNAGKFITTDGTTVSWAQVFPSYTGNALKVLRVNAGENGTEWVSNGEVPLGALVAFDSSKSENLITNGTVNYLKTGVIADAATYPLVDSSAWFSSSLTTLDTGLVAYTSIAAGNGVWIAVAQGLARVSTDGVGFGAPITLTGFGAGAQSIAFANGVFVILDATNAVCATTTNGTTFTYGTLPSARAWTVPAYGNGIWLAVSNGTFAMTSTDGLTWTARTNSLSLPVVGSFNQLQPVAFGAGLFVVISQDASGSFSTTADGITWVSRSQTAPTTKLVNIIFANSLFVIRANQVGSSGTVRTSSDGIAFTNRSVTMTTREVDTPVYYHTGKYVIQDGVTDTFIQSSDAIAWAVVTPTSPALTDIAPLVVVSGTQSLALSAVSGKLYRSDASGYWGAINVGTTGARLSTASGRFMYNTNTNNCSAAITTDGVNWWNLHNQGILNNNSISYNAGLYIIAGGTTTFHTSTDLSTWTSRTGLLAASNVLVVANSITFSLNGSVGTSYAYSTDNINFTSAVFPTSSSWTDVVFGNSTYLAITLTTSAASSATGVVGSWTARTLPVIPVGCVFVSGFFVIASSAGVFYKSSDGVTWVIIPTNSFNQSAMTIVGLFVLGTAVFSFSSSGSKVLVWSGGSTVTTRTITFNASQRSNVASDSSKVVGLVSTTTQYNGVAATDKVLNDVNLKTYHATAADQTNFYKRVS
jgi:hypothetical protein